MDLVPPRIRSGSRTSRRTKFPRGSKPCGMTVYSTGTTMKAEATNPIVGYAVISVRRTRGQWLVDMLFMRHDSHVGSRCSGLRRVRRTRCVGLYSGWRGVGVAAAGACLFPRVEGDLDQVGMGAARDGQRPRGGRVVIDRWMTVIASSNRIICQSPHRTSRTSGDELLGELLSNQIR